MFIRQQEQIHQQQLVQKLANFESVLPVIEENNFVESNQRNNFVELGTFGTIDIKERKLKFKKREFDNVSF
jgi:hypothetical protein